MGEKKGSGMVGNGDYMLAALKRYFGFDSFRPGQEEAVGAVISGRDVMAVMPTGGGKSLCYQIPALLREGVTIVVSPLIALMADQVAGLEELGIPAAYLNSALSWPQQRDVQRQLAAGNIKLLYVAPERLVMPGTVELLKRIKVGLFAIDEAHCVSMSTERFRCCASSGPRCLVWHSRPRQTSTRAERSLRSF